MPRSRGGSTSRRPAPAPARPAAPTQQPQSRQASTMAHPPQQQQQQHPPQQQGSQGSGLFGQMASTAAGVAVGSSIGHAIGGFFGGGSSQAPAEQQQQQAPAPYDNGQYAYTQQQAPAACENDIKSFRKCMDEQNGNMGICGWYLDQLKACQAAAREY